MSSVGEADTNINTGVSTGAEAITDKLGGTEDQTIFGGLADIVGEGDGKADLGDIKTEVSTGAGDVSDAYTTAMGKLWSVSGDETQTLDMYLDGKFAEGNTIAKSLAEA